MSPEQQQLWYFLPFGYLFSILVETPVLLVGLSPRHSVGRRLFAGVWLTACTYPIVILVFTQLFASDTWQYLVVAETFAPVAECALFWLAFGRRDEAFRPSMWRDLAAITLANLASFGLGEAAQYLVGLPGVAPPWLRVLLQGR
jgi:hypothetical protein